MGTGEDELMGLVFIIMALPIAVIAVLSCLFLLLSVPAVLAREWRKSGRIRPKPWVPFLLASMAVMGGLLAWAIENWPITFTSGWDYFWLSLLIGMFLVAGAILFYLLLAFGLFVAAVIGALRHIAPRLVEMFKRTGGLRRWGKGAGAVTATLVLVALALVVAFKLKGMPLEEAERKVQREQEAQQEWLGELDEIVVPMFTYLKANFNSDIGLYREAPNVAPDTYWVYSDGYLAGLDVTGWGVPKLEKWSVLVEGAVVLGSTFACISHNIDLGNGIRSEVPDCGLEHMTDWWMQYADRVLLSALNAKNAGNKDREAELMAIARSMWNGKGMADKFYRDEHCYQTYHVALYYYMTKDRQALEVLKSMQERDPESNRYGGIYTEYGDDLKPLPWTDTNIETTAVTMWALVRI